MEAKLTSEEEARRRRHTLVSGRTSPEKKEKRSG